MNSIIFIMPTILRLLYATGLRIGEVVALQNKDVNLEIYLPHCKGLKKWDTTDDPYL